MKAKDLHKMRMLEHWGNPENPFIDRQDMYLGVLKISNKTFYKHFTPAEIQEIEFEAVELRKKNSSRQRAVLYKALYNEAKGGNVKAIKEFLNRTEGKVIDKKEVKMDGMEIKPIINVTTTPRN